MGAGARVVPHVTCLGCGCTCDDIVVTVSDGRIASAEHACSLGVAWFGDGIVPALISVRGVTSTLEQALDAAASLLANAHRPGVYVAPEVTCEAQRAATAVADRIGAMLDTISSRTVGESILAAQRSGRASLTLGELRHRADTLLCWGTDPDARHPRFRSRFVDVPGMYVGDGRAARVLLAVDVGDAYGPRDADLRVRLDPSEEPAALAALTAMMKRTMGDDPLRDDLLRRMSRIAERLEKGRYVAILCDAEAPRLRTASHAEGFVALAQALNERARAGLVALRGGGNRMGADSVLTWQTGFPMTVDFSRGAPRYDPPSAAERLTTADVALIVGDPRDLALDTGGTCIAIGPRVSAGPLASADVVIDTAVAGIHESGMAVRMDDVPLPVRLVMSGPVGAAAALAALLDRLPTRRRAGAT